MKKILLTIGIIIVLAIAAMIVANRFVHQAYTLNPGSTTETTVKFVSSTISADGTVTAQDQATLHFQTNGKLIYLPVKEGDKVYQGQTIAQLDTYQLQRDLTTALNNYRSTRDTFDQTKGDAQNNYLQAQQYYPYNTYAAAGIGGTTETNAINDVVKRILDQNQATLDNSVIKVELANYALQLARLSSPLNGIVTHEDVTVAGQNITSTTNFTVADPATMMFRANIPIEYIYYIAQGSKVTLAIDGLPDKVQGTVVKVYPSKVMLSSGQAVYQVDIQSDQLKKRAKLDEAGTAIISTNAQNVALVPAWTVLGGQYIWVDNGEKPELKKVKTGKTHNNEIEILDGLSVGDKIIIDPKDISALKYQIL